MCALYVPSPVPYRPHRPSWRQPLYLHLRPLWDALERSLGALEGRVLDVGCGLQPYRAMLSPRVTEYVGLDLEGPLSKPTVVGTAQALPFPDARFDAVVSTQVLEHLEDPRGALGEAARVLAPGGTLVLTVPGVWPLHEAPRDFWRFTEPGVRSLCEGAGLAVQRVEALGGFWSAVGQLANLELQRGRWLRQLVPLVNVLAARLEARGAVEEQGLCWLAVARKRAEPA